MWKLDDRETYWYPVQVPMTDPETGRKQTFSFTAELRRLPQSELEEFMGKIKAGIESGDPVRDLDVCERVFVGWRDIQAPDGSQLEVNDSNRQKVLDTHPAPKQIVLAWMKSLGMDGRAKN